MKVQLHQTHHTIADFEGIFNTLKEIFSQKNQEGLHFFPELYLTGYPLQDLCLQKPFIQSYFKLIDKINDWSINEISKNYNEDNLCILVGGLHYETTNDQVDHISNVAFRITPGKKIDPICKKQLLPNYDIFDERKYFTPGDESFILEWNNKKIAMLICEDMWASNLYKSDPCLKLSNKCIQQNIKLDLIANLSASPFNISKQDKRINRAAEISKSLDAPFAYINRIGGEDEIIFDGGSFVVNKDRLIKTAKRFAPDTIELEMEQLANEQGEIINKPDELDNTLEGIFSTDLQEGSGNNSIPLLKRWSDETTTTVINALIFGLREYSRKSGFNKYVVALSGGVDSAVVVALTKLALLPEQSMEAVYMPGMFSAGLSYDLALAQCKKLGIKLTSLPIKFLHSTSKNLFRQTFPEKFQGLADENIQSRLRGMLLYARSNQTGAMVINTSNKSELAVGYSTQYGDSVGAISLLGDLYKSEVYRIAELINKIIPEAIPQEVITRAPSAELREGQKDSQSLPPYERLDVILECILSYQYTLDDIVQLGFNREEVTKVYQLYLRSEFKRFQFCPILKVKSKSFGFGYRVPICKKNFALD